MVTKMKKYTFLVFHREYEEFLEGLRKAGVLHIETGQIAGDDEQYAALLEQYGKFDKAVKFLKGRKVEQNGDTPGGDPVKFLEQLQEKQRDAERSRQQLLQLQKELDTVEPWGEFDPERIAQLEERGITLRFFTANRKKFPVKWFEEQPLEQVNSVGNTLCLVWVLEDDPEQEPPFPADEVKIPLKSAAQLQQDIAQVEQRLQELEADFDKAAAWLPRFEDELTRLSEEMEFEQVRDTGSGELEGRIFQLQGFVPATAEDKLLLYLDNAGAFYQSEEAVAEDKPPVVLKNGPFSRLFEPIGKLFSLPAYFELDLTPAFAPFFMLFFGLCLGDAGYGLVLVVGTLAARFFVKKELKPLMTLATLLGFSTLVIGALTGTVFGVWLTKSTNQALKEMVLIPDSGTIFYMALGIGVLQILFGMVIRTINRIKQSGFKYGISSIGWIIMILSLLVIMLGGSVKQLQQVLPVANITIFVGIGLILFFNDPQKNIFVNFGKGLWELYNITGFFGDVLSYVRLFALGISSAILGLVINNIASQLQALPVIGPVLFVLFLIVGHTGNLLLSGLGSFVHPMRLTFVEFYNNADFAGGGKEYKPFAYRKHSKGVSA